MKTFVDTVSSKGLYNDIHYSRRKHRLMSICRVQTTICLNEFPVPEGVVMYGGKTGTTSMAKSCLILMTKNKKGERFFLRCTWSGNKGYALYSSMTQTIRKNSKLKVVLLYDINYNITYKRVGTSLSSLQKKGLRSNNISKGGYSHD